MLQWPWESVFPNARRDEAVLGGLKERWRLNSTIRRSSH
jgi:hypothetical protein